MAEGRGTDENIGEGISRGRSKGERKEKDMMLQSLVTLQRHTTSIGGGSQLGRVVGWAWATQGQHIPCTQ